MNASGVPKLVLLAALVASGACVAVIGTGSNRSDLRAPVRDGFEAVADAMQPSCGTLDCHGQITRNLRLVGARGLRLDASDTSEEGTTTPAEYEDTYWAIVALEPEAISTVIAEGGRDPDRLILVRKGRGLTRHKGGALMRPDGDLDRCLTAWLEGRVLADACAAASMMGPPSRGVAARD